MSLEQGKIGNLQFILLLMGFLLGTSIILVPGNQANHDAWLAIILGLVGGIFLALVFFSLSVRFKGESLIRINDIVYGPYLGKVVSLFFLWYLFHMGSLVTNAFKYFFSATILPQTPDVVIVALIIFTCAYAAQKGIEVIARCGFVIVAAAVLSFFGSSLFLIKNFQISNFFPIMETPANKLLVASYNAAIFPFAETSVFMMIIPCLNNLNSKRSVIYPVFTGLLLGGIFLTVMSIRNIGILGPLNGIYVYPTFQADRLINIGDLFTRLEIITVIGFLTLGFLKISIVLYSMALGSAQLLGLRIYQPLILPLGILVAIIVLFNFKNSTDDLVFAQQIYPIYSFPFVAGIPILTFIVALIRKLPRK